MHLVDNAGVEATSFLMYPTASGELTWERHGIRDEAGAWLVNIDLDGSVSSTIYALRKLQLGGQEPMAVGADVTKISGPDSTVYYSNRVATALLLDLQD